MARGPRQVGLGDRGGVGTPAISDYALLSDCQGSALVSRHGSIDWWCAPRFDSRSSFSRLLDPAAGHWEITPADACETTRRYLPGTMVLETTFATTGGRIRLTDALALAPEARGHDIGAGSPHTLIRVLEALDGEVAVRIELAPRLEYGLVVPDLVADDSGLSTVGGADRLRLRADRPLRVADGVGTAEFTLRSGERAGFSLRCQSAVGPDRDVPAAEPALAATIAGWRSWSDLHGAYDGRYREEATRSALVLQALTHQPSGAIVAAPTTSLPEVAGGSANWDYRFAWLRDASLTLHALWIAACPDEAERNFRWMARAAIGSAQAGDLQIMFGVEGERDLTEHELGHLRGYRDSRPVRVGNDAWRQVQLDVFGEVLASAFVLRDQLAEMGPTTTAFLRTLADLAAERWRDPDAGIWEGREGLRHYLSSKVLCWVALDRAVSLADELSAGEAQRDRWATERDLVRAAVLSEGWSEAAGAYTGAFGSDHLDASVLLMPIVGFLPAGDERMRRTIDAVERGLGPDGLVRRWTGAEDGAFFICSFWLADCLARAGEVERAERVFAAAYGQANDLGLLSEEFDPGAGEMLGNFPQALSHVGVITAAWSIDQAARGIGEQEPSG